MTTLTYGPTGLSYLRNRRSLSPTYSPSKYLIKQGYSSAMSFGDAVVTLGTGAGAAQGYIGPYATGGTAVLGVLVGIAPYYDTVLQSIVNKKYWAGSESPSGDVEAWVIDDPDAIFEIQLNGGPLVAANLRYNADLTGTGTPNAYGQSTAALNYSTIAATSTLPFRILGPSTVAHPGYDPVAMGTLAGQPINGWVEVIMNPGASEFNAGTGI